MMVKSMNQKEALQPSLSRSQYLSFSFMYSSPSYFDKWFGITWYFATMMFLLSYVCIYPLFVYLKKCFLSVLLPLLQILRILCVVIPPTQHYESVITLYYRNLKVTENCRKMYIENKTRLRKIIFIHKLWIFPVFLQLD